MGLSYQEENNTHKKDKRGGTDLKYLKPRRKKKKKIIIECHYTGTHSFSKTWKEWHDNKSYEKKSDAEQALLILNKNRKRWEYRLKDKNSE